MLQTNLLYNKIQLSKKRGVEFRNITPFTYFDKDLQNRPDIQTYFKNPDAVYIIKYNSFLQKDLTSNINLYIPFSTNDGLHLELEEEIIDYVIKTSDGQKISSNNNIKHYRGIVKDNPNSLVSLTFGEDETLGLIITDEGNFNLSLTEQLNEYILYDDNNLKRKLDFTCGTDDDSSIQYDAVVLRQILKTSIK